MKNIVIIPNATKDKNLLVTRKAVDKLLSLDCNVFLMDSDKYDLSGVLSYNDEVADRIDLIMVVGGDGSIIDASQIAIEKQVPIIGINLGKVGYLSEIEIDDIAVLDNLSTGNYCVDNKMLLSIEFEDESMCCDRYAVNDIAVSRGSITGIADIKIEDSLNNAVRLRADGVILSTPQGSTAYSFSAGGPIVAHDVESILLTPISSHSFFNRSVLFNSSDVIRVTNIGNNPLDVNVDGRRVGVLDAGKQCCIRRSEKTVKMLTFTKNSMFTSLFRKMRFLGDID